MHTHIEMVLITKGECLITADNKEALAVAGDMFISFPNQIHCFDDKTPEVNHKIIIISPDICPEFKKLFKTKIPVSPVLKNAGKNEKITSAFNNIVECCQNNYEYSETEVRGSLLVLLSEYFRNAELTESTSVDNDLAKNIINYCYENFENDISLQTIADELHISRYYISHLFSKKLHIGFNDYLNSLRIRKACELLKSGDESITEISYAVGYNSPRTFNRCFKEIKGKTPKEYRNESHRPKTQ